MKVPIKYRLRASKARLTGAHVPKCIPSCVTAAVIKQRQVYKYREIFQMMILGEKYSTIANKFKIPDGSVAMIVTRYAPHLLRGKGNTRKQNIELETEKRWNPKTCKYELPKPNKK